MGNPPDFYEVLNIPKDSTSQEIRRAYRSLVKQWHPDKHPVSSKPEAEARFKAISQAYEALHDQQQRIMFGVYNEEAGGGSAEKRAPPKPTPTPSSFYYSGSQRRKPPPIERKLECTLEELYWGCKKRINFSRDIIAKDGSILQQEETQTIRVKPGWKKGTKITFEGMGGDTKPGCIPADVVFVVSEKEHPIFKRAGHDLVLKVEVPLVDALTGWSFSFRLLTGEKMSCSFTDEIIYPGFEKVIKGHGMPLANEKGVRGDLRIKFHIVFPTILGSEQRSRIRDALKNTI